ncbi:MAG: glutamate--tRNA ligase [Rhodospirillales bacterium]|nr:glutamate--tRNA ligase [Rhodospirillales bacterium]
MRVRFAPSPTGPLHVGNARVALVNFLFARRHGGVFFLRFDDTDPDRSRPEHAEAILRDLGWLGLSWQGPERQSERLSAYEAAASQLRQSGRLYACYETEDELERMRAALRRRGRPPVYDRAGLRLTEAEQSRLDAAGRKPYWRFRLSERTVAWHDLVIGERRIPLPSLSDPVLIREDATPLYTFTSIVDDQDFAITHVIRGEDHVTNTAVQIDLWEALGASLPLPSFAHLPLLTDESGGKLSKRLGSLAIHTLREDGIMAEALACYLVRLGTGGDPEPAPLETLAQSFDLSSFSRSSARFDMHQLLLLNRRVLQHLPFSAVADRLPQGATEEFWLTVRNNLDLLSEARWWWQVVAGEIVPPPLEAEGAFLHKAASLLPPEPWDCSTWKTFSDALAAATGRRGKSLFHPLRLALTGEEDGPALARLLPLMGRARAATRLRQAAG